MFVLTRTYLENETIGVLNYSDGSRSFSCRTIENPWLSNSPGSCIPEGKYRLKKEFDRYPYFPLHRVPKRPTASIRVVAKKELIGSHIIPGSDVYALTRDSIDVVDVAKTIKKINDLFVDMSWILITSENNLKIKT